jgi:purine-binding chemotaxis protein CheW
MSVVVEHGSELYALLVDEVAEVMALSPDAFERNPPTLPPAWAAVSVGIYRLEERLLLQLDVARLLALGEGS